ncbi:MAG: HNH endonuclease domain-containing protein, partial [Salinibacter sp.]
VAVPGTSGNQSCLVVRRDLWRSFQDLSLWVEALCIHEWSLFTESVDQTDESYGRGDIFSLLTARPDNRVSLTWERNQIDILLMEGEHFLCPWTGTEIRENDSYNLDHLLPVSVYPMNEMWNLAPADPRVNKQKKRDRIPSQEALKRARPRLARTYEKYRELEALDEAFRNDVSLRFSSLPSEGETVSQEVAKAATSLIDRIGTYRNLARFDP